MPAAASRCASAQSRGARSASRRSGAAAMPGQCTRASSAAAATARARSPGARSSPTAASWTADPSPSRPRPGDSRGYRACNHPAVLGLHRVVEPQLDAERHLLEPLGRQLGPARAGHRDVDAGTGPLDQQAAEAGVEVGVALTEGHQLVEQKHGVRGAVHLPRVDELPPPGCRVHTVTRSRRARSSISRSSSPITRRTASGS